MVTPVCFKRRERREHHTLAACWWWLWGGLPSHRVRRRLSGQLCVAGGFCLLPSLLTWLKKNLLPVSIHCSQDIPQSLAACCSLLSPALPWGHLSSLPFLWDPAARLFCLLFLISLFLILSSSVFPPSGSRKLSLTYLLDTSKHPLLCCIWWFDRCPSSALDS